MSWFSNNAGAVIPAGTSILSTLLEGLLPNFRGKYEVNIPQGYYMSPSVTPEMLELERLKAQQQKGNTTLFVVLGVVVVVLIFVFAKKK